MRGPSNDDYDVHPLDRDYSVEQEKPPSRWSTLSVLHRRGIIAFGSGFVMVVIAAILTEAFSRDLFLESVASKIHQLAMVVILVGGAMILAAFQLPRWRDFFQPDDNTQESIENAAIRKDVARLFLGALSLLVLVGLILLLAVNVQQSAPQGYPRRVVMRDTFTPPVRTFQQHPDFEQLRPGKSEAAILLGEGKRLLLQGQESMAIKRLKKAIEHYPLPTAHWHLARAYQSNGEWVESRGHYQAALRLIRSEVGDDAIKSYPTVDRSRLNAAMILLALTRLEGQAENPTGQQAAWQHLVNDLEKVASPNQSVYWGYFGQALYRVARYEDSRIALQKGIDLRGEVEPTTTLGPRWWYLSMALAQTGDRTRAREIYEKLVQEMPAEPSETQEQFRSEAEGMLGIEAAD